MLRDTCGGILSHKVKKRVAKSRFKKLGNFSSAVGVNGCLCGTGHSCCYGAGEASKRVLCLKVNSRYAPQGHSFNCKYTLYVSVYITTYFIIRKGNYEFRNMGCSINAEILFSRRRKTVKNSDK